MNAGLQSGGEQLHMLFYVDDIVIITPTVDKAQTQLDILSKLEHSSDFDQSALQLKQFIPPEVMCSNSYQTKPNCHLNSTGLKHTVTVVISRFDLLPMHICLLYHAREINFMSSLLQVHFTTRRFGDTLHLGNILGELPAA